MHASCFPVLVYIGFRDGEERVKDGELTNCNRENRERAEEKIDGPPGRTGKPRQKTLQGYYLTDPLSRKRFFL